MYKMSELRTSCPREAAKLLLILLLLTGFPRQLYSMDLRAGRRLTIPAGEVVSTNLYVAGGEVALAREGGIGIVHRNLSPAAMSSERSRNITS